MGITFLKKILFNRLRSCFIIIYDHLAIKIYEMVVKNNTTNHIRTLEMILRITATESLHSFDQDETQQINI